MDSMEGTKIGGEKFSAEEALNTGDSSILGDEHSRGTKIGEQLHF